MGALDKVNSSAVGPGGFKGGTGFETVQARNRREPTSCGLSLRTRGSHIRLVWPIPFGRYAWICPRMSAWAALAYALCKKKKKEMNIKFASGTEVPIDPDSANVLLKTYDSLNSSNKKKMQMNMI